MDIDYRVIYSRRKTIGLTVERDRSIVVRAPIGTSDEAIRQAVEAKKLWLYEKVNHSQKYPPQPVRKEFVTGETLMYLGRYYRLEVTDTEELGVRFQNRFYISRRNQEIAGRLLREWYMARAVEKLTPKIRHFAAAMGVAYERIMISDLRVRWASCTPKNNLNFNWRIVKAPVFVSDYLIVHELAHLLEPNHTAQFWNIIAVQVPRYALAKEWLRAHGASLEEDLISHGRWLKERKACAMVDVPNQIFTPAAAALWRKIPDWAQEKLLANVWCPRCGAVTTITAYQGAVVKGDLVLTGVCSTCGGPVRRLIEVDD